MSGKVKMRCARCGKAFKSSNARQTLCAECGAKERAARAAGKSAAAKPVAQAPALKPKIIGAGARILDPSLPPPPEPEPPRAAPERPVERRPDTYSPLTTAIAAPAHPAHNGATPASAPPQQGRPPARQRPSADPKDRPNRPPRAPRPPREPEQPFELTPEQRAAIEARYLELAAPIEFDGIRTQIAAELNVPKGVVKKAVLELRRAIQMPSWWELQAYKGSEADLERIRQAYAPHLPLPEVGIHKSIAAALGLDAASVYQAIRRIRAELRLPQYNPPELREPAKPHEPTPTTTSEDAANEARQL
jgi:hypothetical protein